MGCHRSTDILTSGEVDHPGEAVPVPDTTDLLQGRDMVPRRLHPATGDLHDVVRRASLLEVLPKCSVLPITTCPAALGVLLRLRPTLLADLRDAGDLHHPDIQGIGVDRDFVPDLLRFARADLIIFLSPRDNRL
jgi:hypothetical protein